MRANGERHVGGGLIEEDVVIEHSSVNLVLGNGALGRGRVGGGKESACITSLNVGVAIEKSVGASDRRKEGVGSRRPALWVARRVLDEECVA